MQLQVKNLHEIPGEDLLLVCRGQGPIFEECQTVKAPDFNENSNQKWGSLVKKRHIRDYINENLVLHYFFSRYTGLICWGGVVQIHGVVVKSLWKERMLTYVTGESLLMLRRYLT